MPRTIVLTEEERIARRRERRRKYQKKNSKLLSQSASKWQKANPEKVKRSIINRALRFLPEGSEIDEKLASNIYNNHRKGSLIVRSDKLRDLMEDSPLPYLPNGTYTWITTSELKPSRTVATHKLSYSDDKIEWEVVTPGRIGVRDRKLHLIAGACETIVANCVASTRAGDNFEILSDYFIWLVLSSVGQAEEEVVEHIKIEIPDQTEESI
jgi:hypothetical protein